MSLDMFSVSVTVIALSFAALIVRWLVSYGLAHKKLMKRWARANYGTVEEERVSALRRRMVLHVTYLFILVAIGGIGMKTGSIVPERSFLIVSGLMILPWIILLLYETSQNLKTARSTQKEDVVQPADHAKEAGPAPVATSEPPIPATPVAPRRTRRDPPKAAPHVH